jgi:hypothetical protein
MKTKWGLITSLLLLASLGIMLAACSMGLTKIGDIQKDPRKYDGKEVVVRGEVTDTFSLLIIKNFTLKDNTGEIKVVTTRPLPKKGETLTVTGTVQQSFSLGSEQAMVIIEKNPNETKETDKSK